MADLGKKKKHKKKRKRRVGKEGDQGSAGVAVPKGPPKRGQQVSLNWANLKRALDAEKAERLSSPAALDDRSKRRRLMAPGKAKGDTAAALLWEETLGAARGVVALDCEMVTAMGSDRVVKEVAAWVGVVDNKGDVLLDSFARPEGRVVDFRTPYSGVRPHNLKNAPLLETVQKKVQQLIQGRLVVGHAVSNDFRALGFDHPREDVRDTSRYRPLMRSAGGIFETVSLKKLALSELGMSIQEGEHNPVEDARAALYLYHKHRDAWEQELAVKKAKMAG
ncbi:unnamed protein product [Ostreobium quekettii]|uniref:RNA exonuclease 4 n=1 Tax=Ostreobium quekettii TaxID=121088 RepID=A0A8S1IN63_9CHLO|nr:unnamed protein product [Ostreobium quekettii]